MNKAIILVLALTIGMAGCAPNSITTNQGLKKHKDMKISYTSAGLELFKKYDFYLKALFREEGKYGMKFIQNDQVIEGDIDWIHFDNNEAVYQIDKSDDIQEQGTMTNPHFLVFKGERYETDNPDDFWVVGGQLIHYRCLEQKYHTEFDRNQCTRRAIFANEAIVDSIESDEFNSIEMRIKDDNRIYYSIYSSPPHEVFDFSVSTHNRVFSYDVLTKKKEPYKEMNDLHFFGLVRGEAVLGAHDEQLRIGAKKYGSNTTTVHVANDNVYYIPLESLDEQIARGVGEKHYVSLIRNEEKIGSVFTDNDWYEIEDGSKAFCSSFLRPLFTPLLCVYGDNFFAKSQVGRKGMKHIPDNMRQVNELDEYYINGKRLSFSPYFEIPSEFSCRHPSEGEVQKEMVQGIGFLFDKDKRLEKLLIETQQGCLMYGMIKLYSADYSTLGEITNPQLLMEYDGELFGYTRK